MEIPYDTAALISCIAIAGMVLRSFPNKWFQFLLGTVLLVLVPIINIISYALGVLSRDDEIMPHGYRFILEKP